MTDSIQIKDLRSLKEKRERLRLQAQYHRMGIEMHLSKGLSLRSLFNRVSRKITGENNDQNDDDSVSSLPTSPFLGVWGMAIPFLVKAISVKVSTGKSWKQVLAHVFRSTLHKVGIG